MDGSSAKVVRRVDWSFAVTAASSSANDEDNTTKNNRPSSSSLRNDDDTETLGSRVNVRVIVANDVDEEEEEIEMEMRATALRALTRDLDVALATIRADDEKYYYY